MNTNDKDSLDDKYQAICDKVQELPNVLTLESISDDALVDSNNVMDSADHVDMNEDHNVPIEAGSSPRQQMSEGEEELEGIMGKIFTLHVLINVRFCCFSVYLHKLIPLFYIFFLKCLGQL